MRRFAFHPAADAEITDAAQYYETRVPGLGADLLDEIERALSQISAHPEACQRVGNRVRRKLLWRFPYRLIYAIYSDRIRVVAFAHQKRRPFYWRKRLQDLAEPNGSGGC